ncbi:putative uncharacterized protein [Pseudomonas sp. StFLB209]|uniref:hypothetical protein n=1 Tax=Pseudomonas sp. StFLB209 TaxID=1028989 RepID=UPI0004F62B0B|nr:hypothetical protein [Pseudomonas sp. StFLB209]BAP41121.1 putative uncharacterized protein [Pseudomonas sp. StFLB209]
MKINMAHLREPALNGGWIDFAVFDAKATDGDNNTLLHQLTLAVREMGFKVDQSALAYRYGNRVRFFGTPSLVNHLSKTGRLRWTHTVDV